MQMIWQFWDTVKHDAETAEDMTTAAVQIGLTINVSKTKYICLIGRKEGLNQKKLI